MHYSNQTIRLSKVLLHKSEQSSGTSEFATTDYMHHVKFIHKSLTSYCIYCFLHSGVIWADRCSANFMLAEQISTQSNYNNILGSGNGFFGAFVISVTKLRSLIRCALLSALSKSSPVYHSPLFPGPTYYPVQSKTRNLGTKKNLVRLPKTGAWMTALQRRCGRIWEWLSLSRLSGCLRRSWCPPSARAEWVSEWASERASEWVSERRMCVTGQREARLHK